MIGLADKFQDYHLRHSWARRYGTVALLFSASDICSGNVFEVTKKIRHLAKLAANKDVLFKTVAAISSGIDENLDRIPYPEILQYGDIHQGFDPCPFIQNPEIVSKEEWKQFHQLDQKGIIPLKTTTAFGNLLARKTMDEKAESYASKNAVGYREKAKKSHLELSSLCVCFLGTVINPAHQAFFLERGQEELSCSTIFKRMPDATLLGEVIQQHDDLTDIFKDSHDEATTQIVSPSSVISDIALQGHLPELNDYLRTATLPKNNFLNAAKLPGAIHAVWKETMDTALSNNDRIVNRFVRKSLHNALTHLPGPFVSSKVAASAEPYAFKN